MKTNAIIIFSTLTFLSCSSSKNEHKQEGLIDEIDTSELMNIAENFILRELSRQNVRVTKTRDDVNGSRYIEFSNDTNDTDSLSFDREFYRIDRKSFVFGDLNHDNRLDFAVQTTGGFILEKFFNTQWHLFLKTNDNLINVENNFGGGKALNFEYIAKIDKGILTTKFQEYDEKFMQLNDLVQERQYELNKMTLVRTK